MCGFFSKWGKMHVFSLFVLFTFFFSSTFQNIMVRFIFWFFVSNFNDWRCCHPYIFRIGIYQSYYFTMNHMARRGQRPYILSSRCHQALWHCCPTIYVFSLTALSVPWHGERYYFVRWNLQVPHVSPVQVFHLHLTNLICPFVALYRWSSHSLSHVLISSSFSFTVQAMGDVSVHFHIFFSIPAIVQQCQLNICTVPHLLENMMKNNHVKNVKSLVLQWRHWLYCYRLRALELYTALKSETFVLLLHRHIFRRLKIIPFLLRPKKATKKKWCLFLSCPRATSNIPKNRTKIHPFFFVSSRETRFCVFYSCVASSQLLLQLLASCGIYEIAESR